MAQSARVFISYASADKAIADDVCAALEAAGVPGWIAPRDVKPGALYADAIVRAISNAKALVLVLSESSIASSHVSREVERACSKKRPIIALRIDSAPLTPALEYFLSESQWIDASAPNRDSAHAKLIEAIPDPPTVGPSGTQPLSAAIVTPRPRPNRNLLTVCLAVGVLAVIAVISIKFLTSKRTTVEPATSTASMALSDKSIAVLPFADMSEKHDQEYFADGMAEEILDLLTKIPGLKVIGRTSSFAFKGKSEDLRTIGTQLNAAYVLEGSVRKSGEQVRITAQLINTRTGIHEWSESYDRPIGDVLKLQDAIAAAVVRELQLTVAPEYQNGHISVTDSEAYYLYLRGRHAFDRGDKEGHDEATRLFQQALSRDPTFADAAAWLGGAYMAQSQLGVLPPAVGFEQARRAETIALNLDPKNVEAHLSLGFVHFEYDWDWAAAEREFQQTAALAPGSVEALLGEECLSMVFGRLDDALGQSKALLAQDSLDTNRLQDRLVIQLSRGHLPEAEAAARRILEIRPNFDGGHYYLGLVLLARGDRNAALVEMEQETDDQGKQQGLALVYYALGRKADSEAALVRLINEHAEDSAGNIAEVYAFRSQSDEAMRWLDRAYIQKDPQLSLLKTDTLLKNVEGDLRYRAFLRKMHLPE